MLFRKGMAFVCAAMICVSCLTATAFAAEPSENGNGAGAQAEASQVARDSMRKTVSAQPDGDHVDSFDSAKQNASPESASARRNAAPDAKSKAVARLKSGYGNLAETVDLKDLRLSYSEFVEAYWEAGDDPLYYFVGQECDVRGDYESGYDDSSVDADDHFVVYYAEPSYLVGSKEELASWQEAFEKEASKALATVDRSGSDVQQAKQLHDYLVDTCQYDSRAFSADGEPWSSHTAYGALVEKTPVCQGYALAYKLLLGRLGVSSLMVISEPMNHAWNLVRIGAAWYHVDVTWDDGEYREGGYYYFLKSDSTLQARGHHDWSVAHAAPNDYLASTRAADAGEHWVDVIVSDVDDSDGLQTVLPLFGGKMLEEDVDYTVSYAVDELTGIARAKLLGRGDYAGVAEYDIRVAAPERETGLVAGSPTDSADKQLADSAGKQATSSGNEKAPAIQTVTTPKSAYSLVFGKTAKIGAKAKTAISYKTSNKKVATVDKNGKIVAKGTGTCKVTVSAKATGSYKAASKTVTVTVSPKAVSLSKVKAGKKSFKASWKKSPAASAGGYQVRYSTAKSMKGAKTAIAKSYKATSKTVKKLRAKKKYYVQVRAYKKVSGKTYYSAWSARKNVKTKK